MQRESGDEVEDPARRSAVVDPEYTCVGFGRNKVCIMNTLSHAGRVYDLRGGTQCGVLLSPPYQAIYLGRKCWQLM